MATTRVVDDKWQAKFCCARVRRTIAFFECSRIVYGGKLTLLEPESTSQTEPTPTPPTDSPTTSPSDTPSNTESFPTTPVAVASVASVAVVSVALRLYFNKLRH